MRKYQYLPLIIALSLITIVGNSNATKSDKDDSIEMQAKIKKHKKKAIKKAQKKTPKKAQKKAQKKAPKKVAKKKVAPKKVQKKTQKKAQKTAPKKEQKKHVQTTTINKEKEINKRNELIEAVETNNINKVKALLEEKINPEIVREILMKYPEHPFYLDPIDPNTRILLEEYYVKNANPIGIYKYLD